MGDTTAMSKRRQTVGMINAAVDIVTCQNGEPLFVAGSLVASAIDIYARSGLSAAEIEDLLTSCVVKQLGGPTG